MRVDRGGSSTVALPYVCIYRNGMLSDNPERYAGDGEMKKVMLIGCGGAGKSTVARELGEILNLPVHHLDRLFWRPGWVPTPKEEWAEIQQRLCAEPEWIIDGNYGGTMEIRLAACDTVVFLDLSRWVCLWRACKRLALYRGRGRPDMTEGCKERINRDFFRWIWNYRKDRQPRLLKRLAELADEKSVFVLRTPREIALFLDQLETNKRESPPATSVLSAPPRPH